MVLSTLVCNLFCKCFVHKIKSVHCENLRDLDCYLLESVKMHVGLYEGFCTCLFSNIVSGSNAANGKPNKCPSP